MVNADYPFASISHSSSRSIEPQASQRQEDCSKATPSSCCSSSSALPSPSSTHFQPQLSFKGDVRGGSCFLVNQWSRTPLLTSWPGTGQHQCLLRAHQEHRQPGPQSVFTRSVPSKIPEAPTHMGISMVLPARHSSQKSIVSLCCVEQKYKLRVLAQCSRKLTTFTSPV